MFNLQIPVMHDFAIDAHQGRRRLGAKPVSAADSKSQPLCCPTLLSTVYRAVTQSADQ